VALCLYPGKDFCEALDIQLEASGDDVPPSVEDMCGLVSSSPDTFQLAICNADGSCASKRNALATCVWSNLCDRDLQCDARDDDGGDPSPPVGGDDGGDPWGCSPGFSYCASLGSCSPDGFPCGPGVCFVPETTWCATVGTCIPNSMACPGPDDCLLPDTTFCDEYNACIPNTQLCPGASTPSTQPSLQPVALPPDASPEPTGSEAPWVCKDSETWVKKNDATNTKTCSWVAARPAERCLVKDTFAILAAEACPEACGACGTTDCVDDVSWHKEGSPEKDCVWASRFSNRLATLGEDGKYGYEACPRAARTCRQDAAEARATCGDSTTWVKKNGPASKNCAWVAAKPEARCMVKDAKAVLAAEACKAACGACDAHCEDKIGWHKDGSSAKDCRWVSRFTNRLAVLGADNTYAWESCRLSARTCAAL